ncbi:response regulator [Myxosarcina sp. GI1]|uniref:response regulator n=1 Tax=Myxosarcina sp. GI1 TaxID=1541065 RepID=UPI00209FA9E3|nr:response regulator [Myxosarcina sp. GI1]
MMNLTSNNGDREAYPSGNRTSLQQETIKIAIVDDQKMIREGLRALIQTDKDLEIIDMASNGKEAIKKLESIRPDVLLMDMEMPGMNGVEATKIICQKFPHVKVLVLSTFDNQEYVSSSLSCGAMGYLLKGTPAKELTDAIKSVHRGYAQIGPGVYRNLAMLPKKNGTESTAAQSSLAAQTASGDRPATNTFSQLVGTNSQEDSSALARRSDSFAPEKFEQTVMLRQSPKWSRAIIWGIVGVTVFTVFWAAVAKIEQVVPAQGQIKPIGKLKEIQVPTNGVVEEVAVEEGERVQKGDLLLVLDSTTSQAQLDSYQQVRQSLQQENKFYRALMNGEIQPERVSEAVNKLKLPSEITSLTRNRAELQAENQLLRAQLGGNGNNLSAEQRSRLRISEAELNSRVAAARLEVEQLERQLNQNQLQLGDNREKLATAKQVLAEIDRRNQETVAQAEESLKIEQETLDSIEPLVKEGALSKIQSDRQRQEVNDRRATLMQQRAEGTIERDRQQQEVTTTQAEIQRLLEEEQRLRLDINQAQAELTNTSALSEKEILDRIAENRQRIADIDSQLNKSIVENDKQIAELNSQVSGAKQTLKYQKIVSPVDGEIFDLRAYPGYVPPAGQAAEPVLQIVPEDELVAEVFIKPEDIGFVRQGMATDVRISAFPYSEFGDVKGEVTFISKDSLPPEPPYDFFRYTAKVSLDQPFLTIRGEKVPLQSGMGVQANIRVRENRTVLSLFSEKFFTGLDKFKEVR